MWEMGAYMYKVKQSIYAKRTEMEFPVPTKAFLQLSPDAVRLFTDPATSPLLTQNLSPKDIAPFDRCLLSVSTLSDLRSVSSVPGRPTSYEQNEAY